MTSRDLDNGAFLRDQGPPSVTKLYHETPKSLTGPKNERLYEYEVEVAEEAEENFTKR